jgi:hypothetical protein
MGNDAEGGRKGKPYRNIYSVSGTFETRIDGESRRIRKEWENVSPVVERTLYLGRKNQ